MNSKTVRRSFSEILEYEPIEKKIKTELEEESEDGDENDEEEVESEESQSEEESGDDLNSSGEIKEESEAESEEPDSEDNEEEDKFRMTEEQREVFDYVRILMSDKSFRNKNPTAICIKGSAGTGKTEILKKLCDYANQIRADSAVFTASTGTAASNYTEGRTAHSKFKFPLNNPSSDKLCNFWDDGEIVNSSIIAYDEVNSASKDLIEMLDRSLRKITGQAKIFGGKIIVFAGDFLQLQPISNDFYETGTSKLSLGNSPLWCQMKHFKLKTQLRTKDDPKYTKFLKNLSKGAIRLKGITKFKYIPLDDIDCTRSSKDLIKFVYPEDVFRQPDVAAKRAILTANNDAADLFNGYILANKGSNNIISHKAIIKPNTKTDFFNDKPESDLRLKLGSVCMFIRNVYEPATFLTGSKVIIAELFKDHIGVRKPGEEEVYPIQRECYLDDIDGRYKWQYPLKLAYATSIHKSQGQELVKMGLDLRDPMFQQGMLYLALSRVRSRADVKVLVTNRDQLKYDLWCICTPCAITID